MPGPDDSPVVARPRESRPSTSDHGRRRLIGRMLVQQGIISPEQLEEVLELQRLNRSARIGRLLLDLGYVTEAQLVELIADQQRLPCVDLTRASIPASVLERLPRELAVKHLCLPWFVHGRQLGLVMADPTNVAAIDAVSFALGVIVRPLVAAESQVASAIARYYEASQEIVSPLVAGGIDLGARLAQVEEADAEEIDDIIDPVAVAQAGPVIRLVNGILADAIESRASDIHVEPQERHVTLRYRIDGALRQIITMPRRAHAKIASRIKVMAHMDITERRRPQDGRMRLLLDGRSFNLRVSTLPTADGEKLVIRVLAQDQARCSLEDLGYEPDTLALLTHLLRRPQGIILVTGPTGSGKTSTLYAALNLLRDETRNIVTIEDPIEYRLEGINQVAVSERSGVTFAAGLRSILRQDPDVIMIGEIRDAETARVAFQAAQTGHLVLSTLHTNDAASAITRLLDLDVPPYLVASSVIAVQAQRLVRRVCECRRERNGGRGKAGCSACRDVGLRGRTGIFELLAVTPAVRTVLLARGSDEAIRQASSAAGMRSLHDEAMIKVAQGVTTDAEVTRVLGPREYTPDAAPATTRAAATGVSARADRPRVLVADLPPDVRGPLAAGLDGLCDVIDVAAGDDLVRAAGRLEPAVVLIGRGGRSVEDTRSLIQQLQQHPELGDADLVLYVEGDRSSAAPFLGLKSVEVAHASSGSDALATRIARLLGRTGSSTLAA